MNAVFDIKRFISLEKRNLLTHKNQFAYASLIIIGYFVFSVLLSFLIASVGQIFLMGIYPVCYIVIACAPGFFEKGMQKNNSVFDFILPGSTVEKFLIMLVNYAVLLPLLCFAIVFLLVQLLSVIPMDVFNNIGDSLLFTDKVTWGGYLKMLAFQSFFLTGYMYFKRYSFLKTLLIIVGVFIFFQALSMIAGMIVFGNMEEFSQVSQYSMLMDFESLDSFKRMESFTEILPIILAVCFPFGLWIVSFFKLREKEI